MEDDVTVNSNGSPTDLLSDTNSLKPRQCALMLSYLDFSNAASILTSKNFKLNVLKDCMLLGAHQTQLDIQKLPSALKKAATSNDVNFQKDFMHPLWLASSQFLFDLLQKLCLKLPSLPTVSVNTSNKEYLSIYQSKLREFASQTDFYSYLSPITEAINAYLKSIRQYPCLVHQLRLNDQTNSSLNKLNNLITYIIFQLDFISYLALNRNQFITMNALNHSFLCIFNLLVDQNLLESLCQHPNYSTLISCLVKLHEILTIWLAFLIDSEGFSDMKVFLTFSRIFWHFYVFD